MRKNRCKTAVALGFFDGVHLGHAAVINAISESEFPVVFTFKSGGKNTFKENNISTEIAKRELLTKLGVKRVCAYDFEAVKDLSADEFVTQILVGELDTNLVCCGYDFRFGKGAKSDANDLKKICGEKNIGVVVVPAVEVDGAAVSSTRIRNLIQKGDLKLANKLLGYELFYDLKVVGGNMQGRTIGFPTINQNMPRNCAMPRFGVYESKVFIGEKTYRGITNIGVKPTAGNYKKPTAETHILNFTGDLYGQKIRICLINFIRDEKKFNSFLELKMQIEKDLKLCK
ncbi:MAG: bifunctional riboflavin kinase/FAD synthetase [Oscillospiraceae bacterium]|nr:bifunctional riboflavin kinase/FAD synthetase [Oscillospiraceae bacterium]